MFDTNELRNSAKETFANDHFLTGASILLKKIHEAADEIDKLQDFAIWLTGCGYDFCQHDYYLKQREKLL